MAVLIERAYLYPHTNYSARCGEYTVYMVSAWVPEIYIYNINRFRVFSQSFDMSMA